MDQTELLSRLARETPSKIVYFVMDGLGGLADGRLGRSELESASIPNLSRLASKSSVGLSIPVLPGITPGSGPGHLGLFGYDPLRYEIGRGALSAAGLGFKQTDRDLAARGNFATVDQQGKLVDRRAGRLPSEVGEKLCQRLAKIKVPGVQVFVLPEKEHRALVVFRGAGLSDELSASDPQKTEVPPLKVRALEPKAEKAAKAANRFLKEAAKILSREERANAFLLRGFAMKPDIPSMRGLYQLNCVALASYPMYKGLAHLVGMEVLDGLNSFEDEIKALKKQWKNYTFFFVHFKPTDRYGEDGNFEGKVKALEEADRWIPEVLSLEPDVLVVTGDHSTPAALAAHSWHPVPFLLYSKTARADGLESFTEKNCSRGSLGVFTSVSGFALALAHALKLEKYGA